MGNLTENIPWYVSKAWGVCVTRACLGALRRAQLSLTSCCSRECKQRNWFSVLSAHDQPRLKKLNQPVSSYIRSSSTKTRPTAADHRHWCHCSSPGSSARFNMNYVVRESDCNWFLMNFSLMKIILCKWIHVQWASSSPLAWASVHSDYESVAFSEIDSLSSVCVCVSSGLFRQMKCSSCFQSVKHKHFLRDKVDKHVHFTFLH